MLNLFFLISEANIAVIYNFIQKPVFFRICKLNARTTLIGIDLLQSGFLPPEAFKSCRQRILTLAEHFNFHLYLKKGINKSLQQVPGCNEKQLSISLCRVFYLYFVYFICLIDAFIALCLTVDSDFRFSDF